MLTCCNGLLEFCDVHNAQEPNVFHDLVLARRSSNISLYLCKFWLILLMQRLLMLCLRSDCDIDIVSIYRLAVVSLRPVPSWYRARD